MIRRGPYTEMIQPYVKGTTNYASIRPNHILDLKMPLPTISEQKKMLKIIKEKNRHLIELEQAKEQAVKDIQKIVDDLFQKK